MNCKKHSNHRHHINPRYKGGGDEDSNLANISDTCHTMWHWTEWQRTGEVQHLWAYNCLKSRLTGQNQSQVMRLMWSIPEFKLFMLERREDYTAWAKENGIYSLIGAKGGSVNAKASRKVAMMNNLPYRQRQLCTQNSPNLAPLLDRWLTFEYKNGSRMTFKFDYNTRVITQKLSLISGKKCSAGRWTSLFTSGVTVAGWTLVSVSL